MRLGFLKHSFSLLAALAVIATPGYAQLKGDPSGDGKVGELNDAFLARQIAIGRRAYDARADVFPVATETGALVIGDGQVDARDVLVFLQGLVGLLGPDVAASKKDVGAPIAVVISQSPTGPISTTPINLTATVQNATAAEVTGVNWTIDADATAAGFTIASTGDFTATLTPPAGGTTAVQKVTVTATPTGPGVANRPRTAAGIRVIAVQGHDQGG